MPASDAVIDGGKPPPWEKETDTRRKGGEARGDGGNSSADLLVPVPRGLIRRMRRMNGETFKVLLYLIYCQWQTGKAGVVLRLKEIADGAGLSSAMAEVMLSALADQHWVQETARGWRLLPFSPEEMDEDA